MQGTITRRPNAHRAERYVGRRGIQPNKVYDSIAGAGRGRVALDKKNRGFKNKLAKLRTFKSQVYVAKIHFAEINFGKLHFGN